MSLDPNRLILTGENPFIRLSDADGHVLYLKSDLTQDRWKIYFDNIALARWLQKTVQGMLNDELSDIAIPVAAAAFDKRAMRAISESSGRYRTMRRSR